MLFSELEKIVSGKIVIHHDLEINRFSADTRTLGGNDTEVFIALKGKRDGHRFIPEAIEKGVKNFVVEEGESVENANFIKVKNSLDAFQQIAAAHRRQFSIPIVGITGSNGKTTVKEWLSALLSEQYFVIKNPKSYNSQIGVPLSVLEIQEIHEVGVFEAGISQVNEMKRLERVIRPSLGIFTTLGNAHSDGFPNEEEKLKEKIRLFDQAQKIIYRKGMPYSSLLEKHCKGNKLSWSLDDGADHLVKWSAGLIQIDELQFHSALSSETDLENVTHSIIAALELSMDPTLIQNGLDGIRPVPMRLELKKGINGCFLLDDTYNNDLQGLKVAIDYLSAHQQNKQKTLILSDVLQSGKSDELLYREINELLMDKNISRLIAVGPRISNQKEVFTIPGTYYASVESLLEDLPPFENEMVILKGARDFALERVVKRLEYRTHGTLLEVNFEALQHNLNQYRSLLASDTKMMVMVKANAYGSGILEVANFLQHQRIDRLGVAYVDEAIQLRKHGIHIPIMIMNPHLDSFDEFDRYQLEAEIFSLNHLRHFLRSNTSKTPIHLKIDTGMHRLGFSTSEIPELLKLLQQHRSLKVAGIFTHFSASESAEHDRFTSKQAVLFETAYHQIAEVLGYHPLKHACNSSGIVRWPEYHYDMVRLGIGLHGFDPTGKLNLRSTSQLKSAVSQVRALKKGETVGYSRKGSVARNSEIAILPIGYEDGFLRSFGSGKAHVMINDRRCPTIGNVCMDMVMIDVTDANVKEGDEAIIFGDQPTIHELAGWAETIPYEILTNISSRVKRIFVWE